MVKLFWNTHNQIKSPTNNKKDAMDYIWGLYHKENSNTWISEILKEVKYNVAENEKNIENGDILIIVDSSIEKKIKQYERLKLICSKIFLFHLGDEAGAYEASLVYKIAIIYGELFVQINILKIAISNAYLLDINQV